MVSKAYRENTWDSALFGVRVFELLEEKNIEDLLAIEGDISTFLAEHEKSIIMARCDFNNRANKYKLISNGFIPMEVSLDIYLSINKRYEIPKMYFKRMLDIREASVDDQLQVKEFIAKTFDYSRFHEDPLIPLEKSKLRMENRIDAFIRNESHSCLVHQNPEGEVLSFIYFSKNEDLREVYFELGGSKDGYGHYTPYFWASLIDKFRNEGFTKIRTRISASNIGVFNIYSSFGFKVKNTVADFHKHIG